MDWAWAQLLAGEWGYSQLQSKQKRCTRTFAADMRQCVDWWQESLVTGTVTWCAGAGAQVLMGGCGISQLQMNRSSVEVIHSSQGMGVARYLHHYN